MHFTIRQIVAALGAFYLPLAAQAQGRKGTVLDPDQSRIVGARVVLDCGGRAVETKTDAMGEFEVPARPASLGCRIRVSQRGFRSLELRLDRAPGILQIQLELAEVHQVVQVRAIGGPPHDFRALNSADVGADELRRISNNTSDLVEYAKTVAGVLSADDEVYVDGLPSANLPPSEMISRISVNEDPFSAEYSDGDFDCPARPLMALRVTWNDPRAGWE